MAQAKNSRFLCLHILGLDIGSPWLSHIPSNNPVRHLYILKEDLRQKKDLLVELDSSFS